jgi:probable type-2 restriction enzyme mthZI
MLKKIKIKNREIEQLSNAAIYSFPKYTTMLINQVNKTAHGTRSKVVGQMSELIQKFDGQTLEEWIEWYNKEQPNAVEAATEKIYNQFKKLKAAVMLIDKDLIREWVKDLVYTKTFCGLKVQQAIISFIAGKLGKTWKLANKKEEGKGIDGYIGETAVQIKSVTYKMEKHLNEVIDVVFIYYEKKKDGLNIEYNESQIL